MKIKAENYISLISCPILLRPQENDNWTFSPEQLQIIGFYKWPSITKCNCIINTVSIGYKVWDRESESTLSFTSVLLLFDVCSSILNIFGIWSEGIRHVRLWCLRQKNIVQHRCDLPSELSQSSRVTISQRNNNEMKYSKYNRIKTGTLCPQITFRDLKPNMLIKSRRILKGDAELYVNVYCV